MDSSYLLPLPVKQLCNGLKKTLPGKNAHDQMEALSAKYLGLKPNKNTRKSAVLILLYPSANEICFPLILRNSYDGFHSGEIGFPGGAYEGSDKDLIRTALREAQEEIGINRDKITILGTLTEIFIGPSNFLVLPVVGYISQQPDFMLDPREVKQIFEVSMDYFTHPKVKGYSEIHIPGDKVLTPYYELDGHKVWGATAKVIIELLSVTNGNFSNTVQE
ncbi:NUDIX hydrolase [Chryseobacterium paridis]|uniref:CoA pyrophosphatase n=1 Tax=Chryseobacterium paridis TaxID=2800328 RepID=A0ABS1FYS5_9FLAO|nr:CoA pyrophosphatase [Chryseobacterium paridis]MBK1897363.1 CoA pyrophosphatase [Chryseobacterium paridis]